MSFYFTIVTRAQAGQGTLYGPPALTNPYHFIEHHFFHRSIPGGKMDLLNGDRVYRVHVNNIKRLALDDSGRRHIPTQLGCFYFDTVDLTAGQPSKDQIWLPVGP